MVKSSGKEPEKGLSEAHTPGDRGDLGDAVRRLAADLAGAGGEQLDLIEDSPDLDDQSTGLAKAANTAAASRRGRGRPPGALNKRNTQVFDYLEQLGHRDPAVTLSMIQTADTRELAQALGLDTPKGRAAVFAAQVRAAADLMPYKYARKPQQIELPVDGAGRPMMFIGEMNIQQVAGDGFMSVDGWPEKPNEINGSAVRHRGGKSHDADKTSDINEIDGESS